MPVMDLLLGALDGGSACPWLFIVSPADSSAPARALVKRAHLSPIPGRVCQGVGCLRFGEGKA